METAYTSQDKSHAALLIEPVWNGNKNQPARVRRPHSLLIEPVWNGNNLIRTITNTSIQSSNRTSLEWKPFEVHENDTSITTSNRTSLEWKRYSTTYRFKIRVPSNRTILEWKQSFVKMIDVVLHASNRTSLEWKRRSEAFLIG